MYHDEFFGELLPKHSAFATIRGLAAFAETLPLEYPADFDRPTLNAIPYRDACAKMAAAEFTYLPTALPTLMECRQGTVERMDDPQFVEVASGVRELLHCVRYLTDPLMAKSLPTLLETAAKCLSRAATMPYQYCARSMRARALGRTLAQMEAAIAAAEMSPVEMSEGHIDRAFIGELMGDAQ